MITKTKIYFAAGLFSDVELEFNLRECKKLEAAGFDVFLPQRDGGIYTDKSAAIDPSDAEGDERLRQLIFDNDINHMQLADIGLVYLHGRCYDDGAVMELGYLHGIKKQLFIISAHDTHGFLENAKYNLMLECAAENVFNTTDDFIEYWATRA